MRFAETARRLFEYFVALPSPHESSPRAFSVFPNSNVIRQGYFTLLFLMTGFLLWSLFAPLESAVLMQGHVQVKGDSKTVQHLNGGKVEQILVSNGDLVELDQPIVVLDATQLEAERKIIEGRIWTQQALLGRLLAERDDHADLRDFYSAQEVLVTRNDHTRKRSAQANEIALFNARRSTRLGEIEVLQRKIDQTNENIRGMRAVIDARRSNCDSLLLEINELESLFEDGYVDKTRIRSLRRQYVESLGAVSELEAKLAAGLIIIGETEVQILQLTKKFKTSVVNEITEVEETLFDLQQRYAAISDKIKDTIIRSPAAGYILNLKVNAIGAVIKPGEELVSVVPNIDDLELSAKLRPVDVDRIQVGQPAEVRFSVFKDAYSISGKLQKVSADTILDDSTGMFYFDVTVDLLESDMALLGGYQLMPGMPAEILVKTGTRTFFGYLTSPLQNMFATSLIEE